MKKIEPIYLAKYDKLETPAAYIVDYLHETGTIDETIWAIAENATPVYIGGLLEWYNDNFNDACAYVDEAITNHVADSLYGVMVDGFYHWELDKLNEKRAKMIELWAYGYIFKIKQVAEITDEQAEALDELDFGDYKYDTFGDIIADIDEILDNE